MPHPTHDLAGRPGPERIRRVLADTLHHAAATVSALPLDVLDTSPPAAGLSVENRERHGALQLAVMLTEAVHCLTAGLRHAAAGRPDTDMTARHYYAQGARTVGSVAVRHLADCISVSGARAPHDGHGTDQQDTTKEDKEDEA